MTMQWAAMQIYSKRAHLIRREVEGADRGTFLPTYARIWTVDGKRSSHERPTFPGYLFFKTTAEGWGGLGEIEGVIRVLGAHGRASRVSDAEMYRLVVDHASGAHNEINAPPMVAANPVERRRRRRPRRSKRLRMRAERAAA